MSTQVETRRGAPSCSTSQTVATGYVEPVSPSISTTTSYGTPNGVIRVALNRRSDDSDEELIVQVAPVARPDAERRTEHARLVAPTRMIGIERVCDELVGRDDRITSSGQVGCTGH